MTQVSRVDNQWSSYATDVRRLHNKANMTTALPK